MFDRNNSVFQALALLFLAVNVLILDLIVFHWQKPHAAQIDVATSTKPVVALPDDLSTEKQSEVHVTTQSPEPVAQVANVQNVLTIEQVAQPNEYYIPLGQGTARSQEWVGLPAAEAYINTERYPEINDVIFEVYMHIPTGNGQMEVKLVNETAKRDVWYSNLTTVGHEVVRKEANVSLDAGEALYRVYVKGSLPYEVTVDIARIRLITN